MEPWFRRCFSGDFASRRELAHDGIERRLTFEADAGPIRQREIAAVQSRIVGKAAEGTEHAGIGFRAAQAEAAGNRERHLIAAVGKQRAARPAVARKHLDRACELHDSVGLRRIDLDDVVAIRAQSAETNEIFHVLRRKQIFAGRERRRVVARDLRQQCIVERIARLLEPAQPERGQRLGITQRNILLLLLGGVSLACARSSKKQWHIIRGMREEWRQIKRQAAQRAIDALYESRLIEAKENIDGTATLVLSENGRKRALTCRPIAMKIKPSEVWDQKWRIVLFDIPEHEREVRNALRDHLTRLGLRKLQQSVGITPFDCKNEIDFIVELLDIRKHVRFVVADYVDNEAYWKRIFRLE